MLGAASGIHPSSYFRSGNGNQIPAQIPATPPRQASRLPIKIIFPTEDEILSGRGGANVSRRLFFASLVAFPCLTSSSSQDGGTLFCPTAYWAQSTCPRHMFHRGQSKRSKVPAHTKISTCRFTGAGGLYSLTITLRRSPRPSQVLLWRTFCSRRLDVSGIAQLVRTPR